MLGDAGGALRSLEQKLMSIGRADCTKWWWEGSVLGSGWCGYRCDAAETADGGAVVYQGSMLEGHMLGGGG